MLRDDFARSGAVKSKRQRLRIPSALNKTLTTYYKAATVRRGGHGTWETRRNGGASAGVRACVGAETTAVERICVRDWTTRLIPTRKLALTSTQQAGCKPVTKK